MRICMILEGSYPYSRGGVSSWTDGYIKAFPDYEFVLWLIGADSESKGKFKYEIPENVVEIHEVFLNDAFTLPYLHKKLPRFGVEEKEELLKLLKFKDPDWEVVFESADCGRLDPVSFLTSELFLNEINELCEARYPYLPFSDLFHTMRSMLLPLLFLLSQDIPNADIYHSAVTGYGGILGSIGSWKNKKPFLVTEHGIYSREREEEVIRAKWVKSHLKDLWIDLFAMLSRCAYLCAQRVTALYGHAGEIQEQLGCPKEKLSIIGNGIRVEVFSAIPKKETDDIVDIGAVVRIAQIKDIKTMIYGFAELTNSVVNAKLHILGDVDNQEYFEECKQLVKYLNVKGIEFVGNVDVRQYIRKLDFSILTSISEGQPLALLETMAVGLPVVATDVGACREMIEGIGIDDLGDCGFVCPPMDAEALASAMKRLCVSPTLREKMGQIGKQRTAAYFDYGKMITSYNKLYEELT
ncbi:GT4 family glycosyltransferase PelF [Lachnospiraceae bacterium ZAX-1]